MVSIPFKRESVSKDQGTANGVVFVFLKFQFPSNGKAYPKLDEDPLDYNLFVFQFPSNGKAYPKVMAYPAMVNGKRHVSIPFKRESVSKVLVSLMLPQRRKRFQFPSNGKAYPK